MPPALPLPQALPVEGAGQSAGPLPRRHLAHRLTTALPLGAQVTCLRNCGRHHPPPTPPTPAPSSLGDLRLKMEAIHLA